MQLLNAVVKGFAEGDAEEFLLDSAVKAFDESAGLRRPDFRVAVRDLVQGQEDLKGMVQFTPAKLPAIVGSPSRAPRRLLRTPIRCSTPASRIRVTNGLDAPSSVQPAFRLPRPPLPLTQSIASFVVEKRGEIMIIHSPSPHSFSL